MSRFSLFFVLFLHPITCSHAAEKRETPDDQSTQLKHSDETRRALSLLQHIDLLKDIDIDENKSSQLEEDKESVALLQKIMAILDDDTQHSEIKRTCKMNLGGHCSTENAVAMANQWNFLKSPKSPGRRRRKRSSSSSASRLRRATVQEANRIFLSRLNARSVA